jgi:hypothetical protein
VCVTFRGTAGAARPPSSPFSSVPEPACPDRSRDP